MTLRLTVQPLLWDLSGLERLHMSFCMRFAGLASYILVQGFVKGSAVPMVRS